MSKRAVVHIGIEKTGSKTIQTALFTARSKLLAETKVLYPSVSANQSIHLATMFGDKVPRFLQLRESGAVDEESVARVRERYHAAFGADLSKPDWETVVLSAEGLGGFRAGEIARLIGWLEDYVDDVRVVAYVRDPVDWTRSMAQQRLKSGETLDQVYNSLHRTNWRRRFTPWLEAVGPEHFRLVSFDEVKAGEGIMAAFCDAAGLPREEILPLAPERHANESLSLESARILDSLNRQRPLFVNGVRAPRRAKPGLELPYFVRIKGRKFDVPEWVKQESRAKSRQDVGWLNQTFGLDLYRDVSDPEPPADDGTEREGPVAETTEALSDPAIDDIAAVIGDLVVNIELEGILDQGKTALERGRRGRAVKLFKQAAQLDPDAPEPKRLLRKATAQRPGNANRKAAADLPAHKRLVVAVRSRLKKRA